MCAESCLVIREYYIFCKIASTKNFTHYVTNAIVGTLRNPAMPIVDKWIEDRLAELGKTKAGLAKALGVPAPRVSELLRGRRNLMASDVLPMAEYLECSVNEIIFGVILGRPHSKFFDYITVGVTQKVEAGVWAESNTLPEEEWGHMTVPRPDDHEIFYGVAVVGPSMNLEYPDGSVLVCVPFHEYKPQVCTGDHVIARRRNQEGLWETTVKELRRFKSDDWYLWSRSDHPDHQEPIKLPNSQEGQIETAEDVYIADVVVAAYRIRPKWYLHKV
jgi:transcriptional regulator with XRE-family HTH domain